MYCLPKEGRHEDDMSRLSLARQRRRSYSVSEYSSLDSSNPPSEAEESGPPSGYAPGIARVRIDVVRVDGVRADMVRDEVYRPLGRSYRGAVVVAVRAEYVRESPGPLFNRGDVGEAWVGDAGTYEGTP
jgi:hypothetical protein